MKKVCEICGKVIKPERLQALPDTKRCIDCARANGSDINGIRSEVGMDIETYKDLLNATRS